jgi:acetyltransferase-like isoleucine patch superfamily enzyme
MLPEFLNYVKDYPSKIRMLRNFNVRISDTAKIGFYRNLIIKYTGGKLTIGPDSIILGAVILEHSEANVTIGSRTYIGGGVINCAKEITIGDDVLIAWGCTIIDHNSHSLSWSNRSQDVRDVLHENEKNWSNIHRGAVNILDKAWIGFNVSILKNVTIGEGAVIGAGSVVTKDVPAWTVAVGNPAKIIRLIPESER